MISGHLTLPTDLDLLSLRWKDYFQCYQQTEETKKYYNQHNSNIWQIFDDVPYWVHEIAYMVPKKSDSYVVSITKIDPGQTVPWHQDKHYVLQEKFGYGSTSRFLIFLEDWKTGHYFQIDNHPIVKWNAGDYIHFDRKDWHLGGNMGLEPFYSVQVTVLNLDKSAQ